MTGERAVWWIRRDLRLQDNQALNAALEACPAVIPVFIIDDRLLHSPYTSQQRVAFIFEGLRVLQAALEQRCGRLIVQRGEPIKVLSGLIQASGAKQVFAEPDHSPFANRRDRRVEIELPIQWVGSPAIQPPGSVLKRDGKPYTVFTPFSKAWKSLPAPSAPTSFPAMDLNTPNHLASLPIPRQPALRKEIPFRPGEQEAEHHLSAFLQGAGAPIFEYSDGRNLLAEDGTSKLSPYLRFGMISARKVYSTARQAYQKAQQESERQGVEAWINELIWRDFYIHILHHYPGVRRNNFRMQAIPWINNQEQFKAWKNGETGYPVVDAAMRQLIQTGWMHNRARMIVASFLTKDLLIDWRWGERWFMQNLVDGDPAANNGGWQWTAGTGTDAAPYFRIFNPVSQSHRHDPQGVFLRRWLPELADVPDEFVHEPWKMPAEIQLQAGCRIGKDYPAPIIDHHTARERALAAYGKAR